MTPYYADEAVTLYHGKALDVLREMADGSVDCCVTSPPYFGLRAYSDEEGEIGREDTPADYLASLFAVFAEVARVLSPAGVFWLNMGDSYYSGRGNPGPNADDKKNQSRAGGWVRPLDRPGQSWGRRKSLLMMPERTVLGLMDDGWILRNKGIWYKPNAMPESADDRLSNRYEHLYLLTRSERYHFDLDAIKVPTTGRAPGNTVENRQQYGRATGTANGARRFGGNPGSTLLDVHETRNPGDVLSIPTAGFAGDHPAVMAPAVAHLCVAAGCKPGGVVLDPFSGSGTTGLVAAALGNRYIGIELNRKFLDLSLRTRLAQSALVDGESA